MSDFDDEDDLDDHDDDEGQWRLLPFLPTGDGRYTVHLDEHDRLVLELVLPGLRDLLLRADDPGSRRLFPTAYPDDGELDGEFRELTGAALLEGRFADLDVVEDTLAEDTIDDEQLSAWLRAMNAARLVLGTRLDVSEDDDPPPPDHPEAPAWAAYLLLGILLDGAVIAASSQLPPSDDETP